MTGNDLYFNGIDGATGEYLLKPMTAQQLSEIIVGSEPRDSEHLQELKWWHQRFTKAHLAPMAGVDPLNLAETGWGVIFAYDADPAVKEALDELLQAAAAASHAAEGRALSGVRGEKAYRPGETKQKFLARHGVGYGPANPDKVPYYLLIVGSPEAIPYSFQYQLDVQYAVGRLYFEKLEEYAQICPERGGGGDGPGEPASPRRLLRGAESWRYGHRVEFHGTGTKSGRLGSQR